MKLRRWKSFILATLLVLVLSGLSFAQGTVTVYTAHHADIVNQIIPWFESESGLKVNLVRAGSGEIIQRVNAERNRPQGDVIWSIGPEPLEANSDLLAPYTPTEIDAIDPTYMVGTNWLPYTGIPMVIIANTDLVSPEEYPTSWKDAADPKWRGRLAYAGADVSGSSFTQLVTILSAYGTEEGWSLVEDIMSNAKILASSGQVPRGVNDGEYAIGFTLEEAAQRYVAGGGPIQIIYPEDGTSAVPDGVALIKGGPNPENGKVFIDFVLSKEVQEFLVAEMQRRSIRTDVAAPEGLPPLSEVTLVDYDLESAAVDREMIIRRWHSIIRQ